MEEQEEFGKIFEVELCRKGREEDAKVHNSYELLFHFSILFPFAGLCDYYLIIKLCN